MMIVIDTKVVWLSLEFIDAYHIALAAKCLAHKKQHCPGRFVIDNRVSLGCIVKQLDEFK
jgi:hypothetical protein